MKIHEEKAPKTTEINGAIPITPAPDISSRTTWALPLLKKKLLAGHHITQPEMLSLTNGHAWRLAAAIHYLIHHCGWGVKKYDNCQSIRVYHLPHIEIERLKQGMM